MPTLFFVLQNLLWCDGRARSDSVGLRHWRVSNWLAL
jgi:hypothetical protein